MIKTVGHFGILAAGMVALTLGASDGALAGPKANGGNSADHRQDATNGHNGTPHVASVGDGNAHALAGGLNSIMRALPGLLRTHDPRMAAIRQFVIDSAEMEVAAAALAEYIAASGLVFVAFDGDPIYDGVYTIADLYQRYLDLVGLALAPGTDAGYDAELAGLSDLFNSTQEGLDYVDSLLGARPEDLMAALLQGANPNREFTPDQQAALLEWASEELGVGDFDGTIDDLLALWAPEGAI